MLTLILFGAALIVVGFLVWWFLLPAPREHDDTRRADDQREPTGFSDGDVSMFWDQ